MKKEEIMFYEASNSLAPYCSYDFLQKIIAKYLAWKVNRKWKRFEYRQNISALIKTKII